MKNNKLFISLVAAAVCIKIFLFLFAVIRTPDMKIEQDSPIYLETAAVMYSHGAFATASDDGTLQPEVFRTPGYPFFLKLLHHIAKIPLDGVVFVQVLLTLLTAWLLYRIALEVVEPRVVALSVVILLFDIPSTIWSLRIMTEALFTLLLVLIIGGVVAYLKKADVKFLIGSAFLLALATYVRPISYFLGIPIAAFIIYANAPKFWKNAVIHAVIFLVIVFGLQGLWSIRNSYCCQTTAFASVSSVNRGEFSIPSHYSQERYPQKPGTPDIVYYTEIAGRSFATMMFNPGSLKYLKDPLLAKVGKVFTYLFMIFWMIGFVIGALKVYRNIYFQFFFLVMAYFILVTVCNVGLVGNERFRVVIMPCIALFAAYGWLSLRWGKKA